MACCHGFCDDLQIISVLNFAHGETAGYGSILFPGIGNMGQLPIIVAFSDNPFGMLCSGIFN